MVRAKADGIRRRRRRVVTASTGSLAVLLLVGGIVAAATGGSDDASVNAGGGDNSSAALATSTTTMVPDVEADEQEGPPPTTTETTLTTKEPDSPPDPQVTETAEPDAADAVASTTTTSTIPPEPAVCPAAAIEMSVTTDRSTYTTDDAIVITAEGTNRAGRDCAHADSSETVIQDQDGQVVKQWAVSAARVAGDCCWRRDATQRSEDRWRQDSMEDGNPRVPPGNYTVTVIWYAMEPNSGELTTYTGSAGFTIEQP